MTMGPQEPRGPRPAWLESLSAALVEALPRLYGTDDDPLVAALITALTRALAQGEVSLDLQGPRPDGLDPDLWPDGYRRALQAAALVGGDHGPLVLEADRLHWRRWHQLREQVIDTLIARTRTPLAEPLSEAALELACRQAAEAGLDSRQQEAVRALLQGPLVLLEGGPGTGKTSTVVQMLAAWLRHHPGSMLHLAAPTGKAAARLRQAIQRGCRDLAPELAAAIGGLPCTTLHRLLESRGERFGRDRAHPLSLDLLVVDELSMVDLPLMAALLAALPNASRLVLVGDGAQLPPVGPGAVLEELGLRHQALGPAAITLTTTYRNEGAIAAVAQRLRELPDPTDLLLGAGLDQLEPGDNLQWLRASMGTLPSLVLETLREQRDHLAALAADLAAGLDRADPKAFPALLAADRATRLLAAQESLAVLTPLRRGRWGLEAIHRALLGAALDRGPVGWPAGTPVLCERNRSDLDLANGDVGVLLELAGGRQVLFAGAVGEPARLIPAGLLGDARPAHALTVHKAQGSEMETVIVLLPDRIRDQRRLLYTALTRARRRAVLITPVD